MNFRSSVFSCFIPTAECVDFCRYVNLHWKMCGFVLYVIWKQSAVWYTRVALQCHMAHTAKCLCYDMACVSLTLCIVWSVISLIHKGRDIVDGTGTRYETDDPGTNPGGGEIFRTCPDMPSCPPRLLYNGYRVSFPGVKRPGRGLNHPPLSSF